MNLIDTRIVYGIGSGTANIYDDGNGGYVVEVANNAGTARVEVADHDEAWHAWLHPFDREGRLDIPVAGEARAVTSEEHALYVALETAEAGDFDVA